MQLLNGSGKRKLKKKKTVPDNFTSSKFNLAANWLQKERKKLISF
jgi:hypothetical protein